MNQSFHEVIKKIQKMSTTVKKRGCVKSALQIIEQLLLGSLHPIYYYTDYGAVNYVSD